MKIFKQFPEKFKCPICGTNKKGECVLIGVYGTQEGNNIKAEPFHLDCINLIYDKDLNILAQRIKKEKEEKKN